MIKEQEDLGDDKMYDLMISLNKTDQMKKFDKLFDNVTENNHTKKYLVKQLCKEIKEVNVGIINN